MPQQRRSKYIRPAVKDRTPYRPDRRDWDYYKLFGPEHQYGYLWMHDMALLLGRNLRAVQKRIRTLWEWEDFNIWYPDQGFVGGSERAVVFPTAKTKRKLEELYGQAVTVKELDTKAPHPNAKHGVIVDHIKSVFTRAIENYTGMELLYYFRDHQFKHRFKATRTVKGKNGEASYNINYKLDRDGLMGFQLRRQPASNFCIEFLRSDARVPKDPKHFKESIRKKYEGEYYGFCNQEWRQWTKKYPQIKNPKNMRMLTICDYKQQEFENLLALNRRIDETGKGHRGFYFIRLADFEQALSVEKKVHLNKKDFAQECSGQQTCPAGCKIVTQRWYTDNSIMNIWHLIWRTPRGQDSFESLLS